MSGPVERAFEQNFVVGITKLKLDVFAVGFDRLATQSEFLRYAAKADG